jgi:hypothetical protein
MSSFPRYILSFASQKIIIPAVTVLLDPRKSLHISQQTVTFFLQFEMVMDD